MGGTKKEFKRSAKRSAARSGGALVGTSAPYLVGLMGAGLLAWLVWRRINDPLGEAAETVKEDMQEAVKAVRETAADAPEHAAGILPGVGVEGPRGQKVLVDDYAEALGEDWQYGIVTF